MLQACRNLYREAQGVDGRGNSRRVRFSGLHVVYDEEGYDHPVDEEGRIYTPLDSQTVSETEHLEISEKETRN